MQTAREECDNTINCNFLEYFIELQSFTKAGKQKVVSTQLGCYISPQKGKLRRWKPVRSIFICSFYTMLTFVMKVSRQIKYAAGVINIKCFISPCTHRKIVLFVALSSFAVGLWLPSFFSYIKLLVSTLLLRWVVVWLHYSSICASAEIIVKRGN